MQTFARWKIETEVMLKKDKGDPKINRQRIFCLYKANCNIFLKIMWLTILSRYVNTTNSSMTLNLVANQTVHLAM
jgi:hypothetical protein